jgi:hypothetical protein
MIPPDVTSCCFLSGPTQAKLGRFVRLMMDAVCTGFFLQSHRSIKVLLVVHQRSARADGVCRVFLVRDLACCGCIFFVVV